MTQKPRVRVTTDNRVRLNDGFINMAAQLGVTGRDKAASSSFVYVPLAHYELINTYRQSWLAQKMIDIVPEDATRNWRTWQAEKEDVSAVEALEKKHRIKSKYKDALRLARITGGSALYFSVRGQLPSEPLDLNRVKEGDLTNVVLFSRYNLTCNRIVSNLDDPRFGEPEMFRLSGLGNAEVDIHPSRLCIFRGANIPGTVTSDWNWGDPLLQSVVETIKQSEAFPANVVSLLFEANVDVLTIPNLMETMRDPGGPGELPGDIRMAMYLKTVAQIKGNNGMLVLEGGDQADGMGGTGKTEFDRKPISFGGISDLWDRVMQVAGAAADIPMTRLWSRSPAGMNATGESDMVNYYQNVSALQADVEETVRNLDEVLIRSALGQRNDELYFNWAAIYEESSQSRVDRGKTTSEILKNLHEMAIFPEDTMQGIVQNAMVETGALPGMEAAIEEHGLDRTEDDEKELAAAMAAAIPKAAPQAKSNVVPMRVKDAAPRSLYISRKVVNAAEIIAHYKAQGFTDLEPPDELHITLAYSKTPLDWMQVSEPYFSEQSIAAGGPRVQEQFGKFAVLSLKCRELEWRHEEIKEAGASWDHPQYQPHVSLSKTTDMSEAVPWQGEIKLGPEIWEEIIE